MYIIHWNCYGVISEELHHAYPGIKYIHDVLRNSKGKVDAVLYRVEKAEKAVVEKRLRQKRIPDGHTLQYYPLIECRIDGDLDYIKIAKGDEYLKKIISKLKLTDFLTDLREFSHTKEQQP